MPIVYSGDEDYEHVLSAYGNQHAADEEAYSGHKGRPENRPRQCGGFLCGRHGDFVGFAQPRPVVPPALWDASAAPVQPAWHEGEEVRLAVQRCARE